MTFMGPLTKMRQKACFLTNLFIVFVIIMVTGAMENAKPLNDRPVIGVVTQETSGTLSKYGSSFFPSSYVKFLWQAGAQVVPIRINETEEYYKKMFSYVNGILYPGGDANITTSGYARAGQYFYKYAKQANDAGDYFPMWGTCLGFELLTALTEGDDILAKCNDMDISLPLKFKWGFRKSRMFRHLPIDLERIMECENITANFHYWCLTPKIYENSQLKKFYRYMSTNRDKDGLEFISSIEALNYPFYGTQFHPEKNNFIWRPKYHLEHSLNSARVSQYFGNFFVNEARKNMHKFPSLDELGSALINNYKPHFTGAPKFDEYYFFDVGPVMNRGPA